MCKFVAAITNVGSTTARGGDTEWRCVSSTVESAVRIVTRTTVAFSANEDVQSLSWGYRNHRGEASSSTAHCRAWFAGSAACTAERDNVDRRYSRRNRK